MKFIKVPNLFTVNKTPRCLPCYISPLPGYNTSLGRSRLLRLLVLVIRRDVDTGRASTLFTYACTEFSHCVQSGMPSILLFHIWAENFFFLLIGQLPSQVQTSFPGLSSPGNEVESNADSLLHVTESVCRLAPQLGRKISIKVIRFACYRLALFVIFYISLLSTGSKASQTTNSS